MELKMLLAFFGGVIKQWVEKQILHAPDGLATQIANSINPPITLEQYRAVELAQAENLLKDL